MHPKWTRRLGMGAIVGAVVWGSVGCAQERDPINRVQPNALDKSFFLGANLQDPKDDPEFYMRNTVIDVPYGAGQDGLFTATYAQPVSRVRWEVLENAIVARQVHEHVENSDHNGTRRTQTGQVVAMFAIQGHFDVRRAYNPQTGEELNVVEENSSDRPWYQRQYIRVDWSRNMVTDGYEVDTLSQIGLFGGVQWAPMSYYESDPNSPNAPVVVPEEGYFDVTTKAFATPQIIDTPFGPFPACFLPISYGGNNPYGNCNPTEVTLRLSFRKVGDTDFEASDWSGNKMEAFGWFLQERYGYERNYGILDERWHRFASKYNLWAKSHVPDTQCAIDYWRDADGNVGKYRVDGNGDFVVDGNGLPIPDPSGKPHPGTKPGADVHAKSDDGYTEAECAFAKGDGTLAHPGSRCDEFAHKCTLPLHERALKTIPWFFGPDSPPDLFPSTRFALNSWNVAIKRAALIGQKADAARVGADATQIGVKLADGSYSTTEADILADSNSANPGTPVFTLCHNPVIAQDDAACGKVGSVARIGDLRYNSVNIIDTPQTPSPWGIMVDADDPLTGEKVVTSVNEWGHVLDIASQGTEDLLRWLNGEISDTQIASGAYLKDWVAASQLGTAGYQSKTLSTDEINSRLASLDTSLSKLNGLKPADAQLPKPVREQMASKNLAGALGPSVDNVIEAKRQALIGTPFEARLATPGNLALAGFNPATPYAGDDKVLAKASLLRGQNLGLQKWLRHQREVTMAKRASCQVEAPEPDALVGMARQAQRLYPLPDKNDPEYVAKKVARDQALHQWIREQFHISVIEHEMGHSMGLRHNFTGSLDALNYDKQYWQLRTRNGAEKACKNATTPHANGEDCVGPRWIDPVTDTEVNNLIWKWGSTTVMDYPGDQTQDMNDLGAYDKAAMRFCYGEVADVDNDAIYDSTYQNAQGRRPATKGDAWLQSLDGFGGIGGRTVGGYHYSSYNDKFNVLGTCTGGSATDPLSASCSGFDLDFVPLRDMATVPKYGAIYLSVRPDLVSEFSVVSTDTKGKQRVRHPYMFGSDEYADTGNVPVFRFDAGADAYEQVQFIISTYENRYIFDNFRRNRVTFSTAGSVARAMDRYFDKMQGMVKSLALLTGLSNNANIATSDPGDLMPLALGGSDVLALFARVLTRPEPGPYSIRTLNGQNYAAAEDFGGQLNTPNGDFKVALGSGEGRFLHDDYDYSKGYWWSSYQTQAGTFAEKEHAVFFMLEAYNHFVANSKEDYLDGRYKNLNFYSVYPNQVRRLLTQSMQLDPLRLGSYVVGPNNTPVGAGTAHVIYPAWEKWDGSGVLDYPSNATILEPLVGWEQQYPGLINAWIYGSTTLTNDWANQIRVFTPNGVEAVGILPNEQVRFRDPQTGMIYAARTFGLETVNSKLPKSERTIGARMIQYANELAAAAYTQTGSTAPDKDGFVYPTYDTATPVDAALAAKLTGYVSNLDVSRELAKYLGTFEQSGN